MTTPAELRALAEAHRGCDPALTAALEDAAAQIEILRAGRRPAASRVGERYGDLVIEGVAEPSADGRTRVVCRCERCGSSTRAVVRLCAVIAGRMTSCGCRQAEVARVNGRSAASRSARRGGAKCSP